MFADFYLTFKQYFIMKKLFTAMSLALSFAFASAQVSPSAPTQASPKVVKVDNHKKAMPEKSQYDKKAKTVSANSMNSGVKMKADGTPDRRYKEAKGLKKDGTPDRRFKKNR